MTDNDYPFPRPSRDDSRRSFLKKGVIATSAAALGLTGTGAAQEGEFDQTMVQEQEQFRAALFQGVFRPGERFILTSPPIDLNPDLRRNISGDFPDFNTRILQYVSDNRLGLVFVANEANLEVGFNEDVGFIVDEDEEFSEGEAVQPEVFMFSENQQSIGGDRLSLVQTMAAPLQESEEEALLGDQEDDAPTADQGFFDDAEDDDFTDDEVGDENEDEEDEGWFFDENGEGG